MSEIRKPLEDALTGVLDGSVPLDTGEAVHKLGHTHVMDRYADDREARRIANGDISKKVSEAQKKIESM